MFKEKDPLARKNTAKLELPSINDKGQLLFELIRILDQHAIKHGNNSKIHFLFIILILSQKMPARKIGISLLVVFLTSILEDKVFLRGRN